MPLPNFHFPATVFSGEATIPENPTPNPAAQTIPKYLNPFNFPPQFTQGTRFPPSHSPCIPLCPVHVYVAQFLKLLGELWISWLFPYGITVS
uniref:Uncharacterized protein n=1 Tax=Solanum lycopersicum TaxID=4081 RepID=A0A3Q7G3I7_SOLLC